MKRISPPLFLSIILLFAAGCTSQKKLAYLNNLPETGKEQTFAMDIPDYRIQTRDVLSISAKAMTPDGRLTEYLSTSSGGNQVEGTGYVVNSEGNIIIPAVGSINVAGLTLDETRKLVQNSVEKVFRNSTVECRLLSFKYTVIGMVKSPGTYNNSSDYMTIFEAIGKAGGLDDFGDRRNLFVIRTTDKETQTFHLNLQDKQILTSTGYFLLPNDIVIVQPRNQKILNMNLPTFSFILASLSTTLTITLLLNNFLGK